jgi:hypothetical protein
MTASACVITMNDDNMGTVYHYHTILVYASEAKAYQEV